MKDLIFLKKTGKKGQLAILTTIMMLAILWFVLQAQVVPIQKTVYLGSTQKNMLETYAYAEHARTFIRSSSLYAGHQAIYDVSQRGGYYCQEGTNCADTSCGVINTSKGIYVAWKSLGSECYPDETRLEDSFSRYYKSSFESYLTKFKKDLWADADNGLDDKVSFNYNIGIDPISIQGKSIADYRITDVNESFSYFVDPYFKTDIDYDILQKFNSVIAKAKGINFENCYSEVESCDDDLGSSWKVLRYIDSQGGRYLLFDVAASKESLPENFYVYSNTGNVIKKDLKVRFAIKL